MQELPEVLRASLQFLRASHNQLTNLPETARLFADVENGAYNIRMYEFIRDPVATDATARTRLVGIPERHRADSLLAEIKGRRVDGGLNAFRQVRFLSLEAAGAIRRTVTDVA
ncbi:hypothetical protein XH96_32860 [Bradyrhizobium sp. CCBAU 51765]|uniref:Uncharacterized protein n=1 Tax=Bradyrhizobium arachidis TaxID=858423 RepID=A0AAE7NNP3_9BRAD|nr:hypothetical protein XH96_32860 [Bradyrhizobium sp. CCBAU 51765]QOZ66708.1 hypothetical protein WN72_10470 [Bradyrhizobium arachidis]